MDNPSSRGPPYGEDRQSCDCPAMREGYDCAQKSAMVHVCLLSLTTSRAPGDPALTDLHKKEGCQNCSRSVVPISGLRTSALARKGARFGFGQLPHMYGITNNCASITGENQIRTRRFGYCLGFGLYSVVYPPGRSSVTPLSEPWEHAVHIAIYFYYESFIGHNVGWRSCWSPFYPIANSPVMRLRTYPPFCALFLHLLHERSVRPLEDTCSSGSRSIVQSVPK